MSVLAPDFREFLRLLNSHGVEYLLIGGYAVGCHGYPRATADLDVWVNVSAENAQRIVDALRAFGFGDAGLSTQAFLQPDGIVRMGVAPLRIEILKRISGANFAGCYADREVHVIDDIPVNVISLARLKANKRASGRLKDLNDLENLP